MGRMGRKPTTRGRAPRQSGDSPAVAQRAKPVARGTRQPKAHGSAMGSYPAQPAAVDQFLLLRPEFFQIAVTPYFRPKPSKIVAQLPARPGDKNPSPALACRTGRGSDDRQ